ncbi:hypothetical protein [Streptomyces pluripotens]|uniref:hypothetical protein n=1 Tax=Streptomyces pluripotens TaxID=1355015 RepID=UPI002D219AE9|nr:hypothetical protein [Streptomyces pluripotens]
MAIAVALGALEGAAATASERSVSPVGRLLTVICCLCALVAASSLCGACEEQAAVKNSVATAKAGSRARLCLVCLCTVDPE